MFDKLGSYIGRGVLFTCRAALPTEALPRRRLAANDAIVRHSVILVVAEPLTPIEVMRGVLDDLIAHAPLAVILRTDAPAAFDSLLTALSRAEDTPHVMTGTCSEPSLEECVDTFLTATWPSEDRFDDWTSYAVLVLGEAAFAARVRAAVTARCA